MNYAPEPCLVVMTRHVHRYIDADVATVGDLRVDGMTGTISSRLFAGSEGIYHSEPF